MPTPHSKEAGSSHDADDANNSIALNELEVQEPEYTSDFEQCHSPSPPLDGGSESYEIPVVDDPVFTSTFESDELGSENLSFVQGLPRNAERLSSAISAVSAILAVKTPDFPSDFEQLNSEFDSANDENAESAEIEKVLYVRGVPDEEVNSNVGSVNDKGSCGESAAVIPAIQDPTFSSTSSQLSQNEANTGNAISISSSTIPSILNPVFSSDFELLQAENVSSGCADALYDDAFEDYSKISSQAENVASRSTELRPALSVGLSSTESSSGSCTSNRSSLGLSPGGRSDSEAPPESAGVGTRSCSNVWDAEREIGQYEAAAETMYAKLRDAIIKSAVPRRINDIVKPAVGKRDPALDALRSRLAKNTKHLQAPPPPPATQLPSKWLHRLRWQNVLRTLEEPIINMPGSPPPSSEKRDEQALEKYFRTRTAALNKKTAEEYVRAPPPDAIELIAEIARGMPRAGTGPDVWDIHRRRERSRRRDSTAYIMEIRQLT
ncbi:hypothetical protein HDU87_007438 [Geranomyces variabilis]|uniref:Uncharacterized protein n=1 Tax=Geranomyces variabilis TaxID=109894 RepID=A0AAD5TRL8_9FUNG|nr:hypothetical protein HDU87_007438 [Geranomyces variabilis]